MTGPGGAGRARRAPLRAGSIVVEEVRPPRLEDPDIAGAEGIASARAAAVAEDHALMVLDARPAIPGIAGREREEGRRETPSPSSSRTGGTAL